MLIVRHLWTIVLLPLLAAVSVSVCAIAADKPNIIIFLVDDMGVMDTSVPFLTDADGEPSGLSVERVVSHAEHGAPRCTGHTL